MRRVVLLLSLLCVGLAAAAPAARADGTRIVVARAPGVGVGAAGGARAAAGARLLRTTRLDHVEVDVAADPDAALRSLRADPDVSWAQLDHRRTILDADPRFGSQWALENTGANPGVPAGTPDADMDVPDAWTTATGRGVTVAVVDSGVDAAHPDLAGAIDPGSRDLVGAGGPDPSDANGHGTHVAGIIAARRANGIGIAGVAPDASLLVVRALGADGSGYDSDIAEAFDYAGDHGARIVNASLGGGGDGTVLETAIAAHPSTLFVVAAGNDGVSDDRTPTYPCSLPDANVLCVGASNETDGRASFSNYGRRSVDVFAPGTDILSTYPPELEADLTGYELMDGTSMATPMISGEAALLLQARPDLTIAALKQAILDSGDARSAFTTRSVSGRRANAAAALAEVAAPGAAVTAPVAAPSPESTPAPSPEPTPAPAATGTDSVVAASPDPATTPAAPGAVSTPAPTAAGRLRVVVSVNRRRHRVRASAYAPFLASGRAPIALRLERRRCNAGRCRWHHVAVARTATARARVSRRVAPGRYRALATASGIRPAQRTFRMR